MLDSIRIKTRDEETAVTLAGDTLARFQPALSHESGEWEVHIEAESDDDLPDLLAILRERLRGSTASIDVIVNGETYPLEYRP